MSGIACPPDSRSRTDRPLPYLASVIVPITEIVDIDQPEPVIVDHVELVVPILGGRSTPSQHHDTRSYRDETSVPSDPLFSYASDAGPRHRWEAGQPELLVASAPDPIPRVNLARWTTWSDSIRTSLGRDHPDTLRTRRNIAFWTGRVGEPAEALRLSRALLPDREPGARGRMSPFSAPLAALLRRRPR